MFRSGVVVKEIRGRYGLSLTYNQNVMKFGAADAEKHIEEREVNRLLLEGETSILQQQVRYAQSYMSTNEPTLLHWKDSLIALACKYSIRCAQYYDQEATKLTGYATHYWHSDVNRPLVELTDINPKAIYTSGLGSIAFYGKGHDHTELSVVKALELSLKEMWASIELDIEDSPKLRHTQYIFDKLNFNNNMVSALNNVVGVFYERTNKEALLKVEEYKAVLKVIRQNIIRPEDWNYLGKRMLLREYDQNLEKVLTKIAEKNILGMHTDNLTKLLTKSLEVLYPGGTPLLYLAFAVEGLLKASRLVIEAEESVTTISYKDFYTTVIQEELKIAIAEQLALSYDAFSMLACLNTFEEASETALRIRAVITQLLKGIEAKITKEGLTRLYVKGVTSND
jgi:hypothetical protein